MRGPCGRRAVPSGAYDGRAGSGMLRGFDPRMQELLCRLYWLASPGDHAGVNAAIGQVALAPGRVGLESAPGLRAALGRAFRGVGGRPSAGGSPRMRAERGGRGGGAGAAHWQASRARYSAPRPKTRSQAAAPCPQPPDLIPRRAAPSNCASLPAIWNGALPTACPAQPTPPPDSKARRAIVAIFHSDRSHSAGASPESMRQTRSGL